MTDPHAMVGKLVEHRREPTVEGNLLEIPARATVTLIDFWSTSCEPCRALMPRIESIRQKYAESGVMVVGIARDDNPGLVLQTTKQLGVRYPVVLDQGGDLQGAYRVGPDLPSTFVVDRSRRVRFAKVGGRVSDADAIEAAVDQLASEEE